MLAARKHVEAVAASFVGEDLEIGQERGDMLDLIDNGALAKLREKSPGIGFGKFPLVRRFQVGVFQIGKGRAAQGSLARLPWPGHGHERVLLEERRQTACDFALDHVHNDVSILHNLQVLLSYCAFCPPRLPLLLEPRRVTRERRG